MYTGYSVEIDTDSDIEWWASPIEYTDLLKIKKDDVKEKLREYMNADGPIEADKIMDDWFPKVHADIFLSHSHADIELAEMFAYWLEQTFEVTVFIDSFVWGNYRDLLFELDKEYAPSKDKKYFDYELRNVTTSHTHMMLATALTRMIDQTECFMFLNTENSLIESLSHGIDKQKDKQDSTYSPWIFHELYVSARLEKYLKRPSTYKNNKEFEKKANVITEAATFAVKYVTDLTHLRPIGENQLNAWKDNYITERYPLDALYKLTFPITENIREEQ